MLEESYHGISALYGFQSLYDIFLFSAGGNIGFLPSRAERVINMASWLTYPLQLTGSREFTCDGFTEEHCSYYMQRWHFW